jgi:hypothetical protein
MGVAKACRGQQGALCGANLETGGQNARMRMGVVALSIALASALLLQYFDAPKLLRAGLFIPFFFAGFGAMQGLYRTCPGLAAQGMREGVSGDEEHIVRSNDLERTRRLAKKVVFFSAINALAATSVFLLLP